MVPFIDLTRQIEQIAESIAREILSLPLFPELKAKKIGSVIKAINEFFGICN